MFFFISVTKGKTLVISHNGIDSTYCGQNTPCQTMGFVLCHRASDNDIIRIENNKFLEEDEPFIINRTFPFVKNLTLLGFNGRPTILAQTPVYLFEETEMQRVKVVTMRIENIIFKGIGIVRLTKRYSTGKVIFRNCHFEDIVSDRTIIFVKDHNGVINFHQCHFINNVAKNSSRMISIYNSHCVLHMCSFMNNLSNHNGSISLVGGYTVVKDSSFENNTVASEFGDNLTGGAIYTASRSAVEILNCSFQRNVAISAGGAIFTSGKNLIIKISLFQYNTVSGKSGNGGAVSSYASTVCSISKSRFAGNFGKYFGGAIFNKKSILLIASTSFNNNSALKGGAIYVRSLSRKTDISTCSFKGNVGYFTGGAVYCNGKELLVKTSSFDSNIALSNLRFGGAIVGTIGTGGAISVGFYNEKTDISNSIFNGNNAFSGGAISLSGKGLFMKKSFFSNNSAFTSNGGALSVGWHNVQSDISNCTFEADSAKSGGAISYYGKKLLINTSVLRNNTALLMGGQGGALYLDNGKSIINHCTFEQNKASFLGGTIVVKAKKLLIRKSEFLSSSYSHDEGYSGGEFLYSKSEVTLEHVSFQDVDNENLQNSLIIHQGHQGEEFPSRFVVKAGVRVSCLPGKYMRVSNQTSWGYNSFTYLVVSCSFCSGNLYSLSAGYIYWQNKSIEKTHQHCFHCPLGGVCERGRIRASPNSWGYILEGKVLLTTCPFGYCCVKDECRNYYSCHKGRKGNLCSQCEDGLTENLVTSDCLLSNTCKHHWFSIFVVIAGIGYVLIFMYMDQTANIIKALLIPNFMFQFIKHRLENPVRMSESFHGIIKKIKLKFKKKFSRNYQLQYITNDICIEETENEDTNEEIRNDVQFVSDEDMPLVMEQNITTCNKRRDDKTINFLPGLLKVLIFFYQINILFKIQAGSKSVGFALILKEVVYSVFNLRIDGIFTQGFSWCPISNLRPVKKIIMKNAFIVYLFTLVSFIFIVFKMARTLKVIGKNNYESTKSRLLCCILRLILISYASITTTCFSLLSCVQLGPLGSVLFIDASISCYRWWQIVIIFAICFWVTPLPIAIYVSSHLLHRKILSLRTLILSLLFPMPAMLYWLYIWVCCRKKTSTVIADISLLDGSTKEVLKIMEGPFRKSRDCNSENEYRIPWESVLIGRRLVLIFIKTFVINTFIRLSLMLLCTVVFLVHHFYIKPFTSNLVNNVETVSLSILTTICILNLVPAYIYAYPPASYIYVSGIIYTQQQIESALTLIFPFLISLSVLFLALMRIFQFLFWLSRYIMSQIIYIRQRIFSTFATV